VSKFNPQTFWEKLAYIWREFWAAFSLILCAGACSCVPSISLAAGSATASDVALKGGMSLIDGTFITACLMGIASIISACGGVIWANKRNDKKAQRPLDTDDTYVTHGECKSHRCALEKRIDSITPMLKQISDAVERSASRAEERAVQLHRRLDPIVERVAANSAKIELFENLARQSTIGGKK